MLCIGRVVSQGQGGWANNRITAVGRRAEGNVTQLAHPSILTFFRPGRSLLSSVTARCKRC